MILAAPATPSADRRQLTSTSRALLPPDRGELLWRFDYWIEDSTRLRDYLWAHDPFDVEKARTIVEVLTPEAVLRILRYLVGNYYTRVSTPHQHTIGMQLRQLREFLERRRWQEVLVGEEVVSGSRRRPERDRLLDAARRREIDIIAV